jgi:hypothetical protein
MSLIRNLEWLDHNSQRNYPLENQVTGVDTTASFTLPEDLIVGLQFAIDFALNVDPAKFFIKTVANLGAGVQITLGYDADGGAVDVATALVSRSAHTKYRSYVLLGLGDYENSRGQIQIGTLDSLDGQPSGEFSFDADATRLEPDAIRPSVSGVASLQVQNGAELSAKLTGHVRLVAGRNTRLRVVQSVGNPSQIIFDAIEGAGLTEDCVCTDELSDPIRTIQGVPADGSGNFQFVGDECLEFSAINNGLRADDVCSEPCCGCTELAAITQALEAFGSRATTLENFLVSLEARVTQMDQVVLGSRLGDRGCTPAVECS